MSIPRRRRRSMMLMVKKSKRNTLTLGWNWHQKRSQKESKAKDRALKTLLWIVKDAEGWDPVAKWLECCVEEVKYAEMRELQRQKRELQDAVVAFKYSG